MKQQSKVQKRFHVKRYEQVPFINIDKLIRQNHDTANYYEMRIRMLYSAFRRWYWQKRKNALQGKRSQVKKVDLKNCWYEILKCEYNLHKEFTPNFKMSFRAYLKNRRFYVEAVPEET